MKLYHSLFVGGLMLSLLCGTAFALDEVVLEETRPSNAGDLIQPGATFISTWSLGDRESGALGFVVDRIDPDTDEVIGRLYEPSFPRKTREFTAILDVGQVESTFTLRGSPDDGLDRNDCTTATANRFLQKGSNVSLTFTSDEDSADRWVGRSGDLAFNFRSRGVGNYAKRLEEIEKERLELETKILEAVKRLAVWSGTWNSRDGKTGNISVQFGSDPAVTDKFHIVGRFFDMDAPHKSKPFAGSVALGESSRHHFSIKMDYNAGISKDIAKTESQQVLLMSRTEYTVSFILDENGELEGTTNGGIKINLKKVAPKDFMEKMNALKERDSARRAAIVEAVKPGSVYKGVATGANGWSGEVGFRFKSYEAQGHSITGEVFELSAPELKAQFKGQLALGPDAASSISFEYVGGYHDFPSASEMKTDAGKRYVSKDRTGKGFHFAVNGDELVGTGGYYYRDTLVLTRTR